MHDWQEVRRQHGRVVFGAVFRILKRHDQALDCYQEVFLEAFQQCDSRPVRNWAALLRWLAVRRALDRLRKERRATVRVTTDEDAVLLPDVRVDPSAEASFASWSTVCGSRSPGCPSGRPKPSGCTAWKS